MYITCISHTYHMYIACISHVYHMHITYISHVYYMIQVCSKYCVTGDEVVLETNQIKWIPYTFPALSETFEVRNRMRMSLWNGYENLYNDLFN